MKSSENRKEVRIPAIVLQIFLIVSISVFTSVGLSIAEAPRVEAQEFVPTACCTSGPSACTDLPHDTCTDVCGEECQATTCAAVSKCELGCGIDVNEGICAGNTPKSECENNADCEWEADPFCNVNRCEQICCILGNNAQFVTQERCQILSEREGLPIEVRDDISDAAACYDVVHELDEGACMFQDNFCKFTTQVECNTNIGGTFYEGFLCTNENLENNCEIQDQASCIEGRDGVYFVDTCGNRANIYDSSKKTNQAYWNTVKYPSTSCGSNSDNINGQCGNCDYNLGSICGEFRPTIDNGNMDGLTCRDLNCQDSNGDERINGEAWCVYDGKIGKQEFEGLVIYNIINIITIGGGKGKISADTVGSRHVREVCNNGVVQQEACADYRQEICVENPKTLSTGEKVDNAICRVNLADDCVFANTEKTNKGSCDASSECGKLCAANPDCRIQQTNIASKFKFNTCVPNHPVGRDFGSEGDGLVTASDICSIASRTCVVAYKKKVSGKWRCKTNCDCQNSEFTTKMNNLCVSVGDCGAYTNYEGNVTFGGYSRVKKGGKAKTPPRLNESEWEPIFSKMSEDSLNSEDGGFFKDEFDLAKLGEQGVGDPFLVGYMDNPTDYDPAEDGFMGFSKPAIIAGAVAAIAFSIALSVASITGTAAAGTLAASGFGSLTALGPFAICIWCVAVVIAIIILIELLGIGKIKVSKIVFTCKPWQQPYGGEDCDKCGEDGVPCTRYRCESLGKRCNLINENTGVDECITLEGEDTIPVITPWDDILNTTKFRYQDISTNGFKIRTAEGNCIQAFTPINFGVNTDVLSECKWDTEALDFEDMSFDFIDEGISKRNHSLLTDLPSVESILAIELNPDEGLSEVPEEAYEYLLDQVGDLNLYVKCVNLDGVQNDVEYRINFCVDPGPDLTPPVVTNTVPEDGSTVRFDSVEEEVIIYISEPAECKWSNTQPSGTNPLINFNTLGNSLECGGDADGVTAFGYPCNSTLPIVGLENKYYVMCRDQPWLGENVSRNVGNTYEYNLFKTETQLVVDSILPSGTIYAGTEPITVTLEATTSEGANGGRASCDYQLNDRNFITFFQTDTRNHVQILNQMVSGDYELNVRCEDYVGNIAEGNSNFTLELDTEAPIVTRVFSSGSNLMIITNEDANCYYRNDSTSSCSYLLSEGIPMSSQVMEHSTSWNKDDTYYIKCEDIWGNQPNQCNIVVRPYTP